MSMIQAQQVMEIWTPSRDVYVHPVAICEGLIIVVYLSGRAVLAAPKYELLPERGRDLALAGAR